MIATRKLSVLAVGIVALVVKILNVSAVGIRLTNMTSEIAEILLEQFKQEMLVKLKRRAEKHPDDNFLSMGVADMVDYPLALIFDYMNEEVEELFTARAFSIPFDIMKEDVDVANMVFIEWALRKMREGGMSEAKAQEEE